MEIDESGWRDLEERLEASGVDPELWRVLVDRLTERLVGHFGADVIEVHLGKNDPARHAMREVAAAAIAHLLGDLDEQVLPPWDDSWRADPRTASWRS